MPTNEYADILLESCRADNLTPEQVRALSFTDVCQRCGVPLPDRTKGERVPVDFCDYVVSGRVAATLQAEIDQAEEDELAQRIAQAIADAPHLQAAAERLVGAERLASAAQALGIQPAPVGEAAAPV